MEHQAFDLVAMVHLIMLSLWGGVVATEGVIEVLPFRQRDLHAPAIRFHFWIDLLVELPIVLAVTATGFALLLMTDPLTPLHLVKAAFGGAAVTVNLYCIAVVVKRGRGLRNGVDDAPLWSASRRVLACFAVGLLCAAGAAFLGFRFALERLG